LANKLPTFGFYNSQMKKLIVLSILAIFVTKASSQDSIPVVREVQDYLFKDFAQGTVRKKTGELFQVPLNYNTLTEEMIFEKDGQKLALAQLQDIDTVYINERVFVPVGKVFYEKATNTARALYIEHKNDIIPPGKNIGYGTYQSGSVKTITNLSGTHRLYSLDVPMEYKFTNRTTYWLSNGGAFVALKNMRSVLSAFPEKSAAIKAFVKTNNISFAKDEAVIKLILFCN